MLVPRLTSNKSLVVALLYPFCLVCMRVREMGEGEWEWERVNERPASFSPSAWQHGPSPAYGRHAAHALTLVGHERAQVWIRKPISVDWHGSFCPPLSPKPVWVNENSNNEKCRATWDLQLCLKEFGLIPHGFQTTKLQSGALWN
jgi:hypothetical protein